LVHANNKRMKGYTMNTDQLIQSIAAAAGVHPSVVLNAAEACADFIDRNGAAEEFISDTEEGQTKTAQAVYAGYARDCRRMSIKALSDPTAMAALQGYVLAAAQEKLA